MSTSPQEERPAMRLPWQASDRFLEAVAAAGMGLLIAGAVVGASRLPESVPVHFDLAGEPDGWGPRSVLLGLPLVAIAIYTLLSLVARVPHWYNYPRRITPGNAERQYRLARRLVIALKAFSAWLFLGIFVLAAQVALGLPALLVPWIPILVFGFVGASLLWYFSSSREGA